MPVLVLLIAVAGIVWGLLAFRAPAEGQNTRLTLTDGGANGVTFKATLEATSPGLKFTVELDTHTVDLAAYNVSNIVLENSQGTRFDATDVSVLQRTSHHVEAVLVFPATGSQPVALIAKDLAGIPERRLVFNL
jgi:hypothetical protein